ncbi:MAG: GNAT family N-acetyltransferase [Planctomycetota bacterium]|jgi:ribosomal protein S18 acetylase RimI-like enzyme
MPSNQFGQVSPDVIEYRSFRNYDPPQIVRLWNEAKLGAGAARGLPNDLSFDMMNYSQPYFDRDGLIMACKDSQPVGFVHAGFGCSPDGNELDRSQGVICAVVVHPDHRRQGIGRELVHRACNYLREQGATTIDAGPAPSRDPFYFGLYGGPRPAGFLESDPAAAPFFEAINFRPTEQYLLTSRQMSDRDPVNFRLTMIKRKWELALVDSPDPCPWWWSCRYGRLDALFCVLIPRGGGQPVAAVTVVGLDTYTAGWHEQAIGVADLWVDENRRREGFGQTLLVEVIKRLRQETVSRITANIRADDDASVALFRSTGFQDVDRGTVYRAV